MTNALGLEDVQDDLRRWHMSKYPAASLADIGLKLAEESSVTWR